MFVYMAFYVSLKPLDVSISPQHPPNFPRYSFPASSTGRPKPM